MIRLAVLTQYRCVTDRRTSGGGTVRAYAEHRVVKIGQYFSKLRTNIECHAFMDHGVYIVLLSVRPSVPIVFCAELVKHEQTFSFQFSENNIAVQFKRNHFRQSQ